MFGEYFGEGLVIGVGLVVVVVVVVVVMGVELVVVAGVVGNSIDKTTTTNITNATTKYTI